MIKQFYDYICRIRSKSTADAYIKGVKKLISFIREKNYKINNAPKNMMQEFVIYLVNQKLSSKSISLLVIGANRFIDYLNDSGYTIPKFNKPELPKHEYKIKDVVSDEIIKKYIIAVKENIDNPYKTLLLLLIYTGMRVEEACTLKKSSFSFDDELGSYVIVYGKGKKERYIPLSKEAITLVNNYIVPNNSTWYFPLPNDNRKHIDQEMVRIYMRKVREIINVSWLTPHKLRHYFAESLRKKGVDIKTIQEILGHSNITTTMIYLHPSHKEMRNAINKLNN